MVYNGHMVAGICILIFVLLCLTYCFAAWS
jgi:hypothetical protein